MVSEENRLGLYISLPVYFACLAACAVWAHFKVERLAQKSGEYLFAINPFFSLTYQWNYSDKCVLLNCTR
jgi:hypothetical protein